MPMSTHATIDKSESRPENFERLQRIQASRLLQALKDFYSHGAALSYH